MYKVFDRLHDHGKTVYRHAKKHHKKYIWGVAWFFWLFKIFSFIVISLSTYFTANANIATDIAIQIPATTIQQENQNILAFDIQNIDNKNIWYLTDLSFYITLHTNNEYVDAYIFTENTIDKQIYTLQKWKNTTWMIQIQDMEKIQNEIISWNKFLYIEMASGLVEEYSGIAANISYIPKDTEQKNEVQLLQSETQIDNWEAAIQTEEEWNNSEETINENINENINEGYEVVDKNIDIKKETKLIKNTKTAKNIELTSHDKKIKIKIPKNTKIKTSKNEDYEGIINQPEEISLDDVAFEPKENVVYAFEVGDSDQSLIFTKNNTTAQYIDITVYVDSEKFMSWEDAVVYYSNDKIARNTLEKTIVQKDEFNNLYVHIQVDHMTTFLIGKLDSFDFFIGDKECNELTETSNEEVNVHACIQWTALEKIKYMRFSNTSQSDLEKQERIPFENAYNRALPIDAQWATTLYAQYWYDNKGTYTTVNDDIIVSKTSIGEADIAIETISKWSSFDISNSYNIIQSDDGISKVILDSTDINSSILVSWSNWDGIIKAPTIITDNRQASKGENGLPNNFIPSQTVLVWSEDASLTLDNNLKFSISFQVTDPNIHIGAIEKIYRSNDGNNWELFDTTCTIDEQKMCNFESSHLTLFTVGTITWNNLEFVTQDFWDQNPTTGQIIDAFFGTWGNPSAYTTSRSTGCRPTNIAYYNGNWWQSLVGNTIWIFQGNYTFTNGINLWGIWCIAMVGKWNVTITNNSTDNVFANGGIKTTGIILDNIQIDAKNVGIYLSWANNSTINDVQVYSGTIWVYVDYSNNNLINNTQVFNNSSVGFYIRRGNKYIINNSQSFNNLYGIYSQGTNTWVTINNSQIYNNNTNGITSTSTNWLIVNNTEIYNNIWYGISLSVTPNVKIYNSRIFNNTNYQVYAPSWSSGQYYGTNIAYPNAWFANFSAGNYDTSLWRSTGTLSTTNLWYDCDFVTNPMNGVSTSLYTTSNCSNTGKITTRSPQPIVKYMYGNNMLSDDYVLRQAKVVDWSAGLTISAIPYHGHRFIGEYYDPSGRDINPPIILFTGETPPEWTNIISGIYSWYFNVRSYIYEPNLFSLKRQEASLINSTSYTVYDSGLIFMSDLDNINAIWDSTTELKDQSLYKNNASITNATWTGNGKYDWAYYFDGNTDYIKIQANDVLAGNTMTFSAWVKALAGWSSYPRILGRQSYGFDIAVNANGYISFYDWVWTAVSSGYILNNRHHIVVTVTTNDRKIYLDGEHIYTEAGSTRTRNSWPIYLWSTYVPGTWFNGYIDDVKIYNRELSADDIQHLYNSNFSAKSDHREYVVNYTGVNTRANGTYTYGYTASTPITDSDSNTNTATTYVVKRQNCGANFTITRNNDNFINSGFRNQNPTDCDIVYALYGTWTNGQDTSAYTKNWNGRDGRCNYTNMNIVYLTGGTNKIPLYIPWKTIYVLESWAYIQTWTTYMDSCSVIIGKGNTASAMYTNTQMANSIEINKVVFTILDNIAIDGTGNGAGGTHSINGNALYYLWWAQSHTINNSTIKNNNYGIYHNSSSYRGLYNSHIYNTTNDGMYLNSSSNSTIENTSIYNNGWYAILPYTTSSNNTYSGIQLFNNNGGIMLWWSKNIINNSQIFNTTGAAIYLNNANDHTTFNNLQLFNNGYGIQAQDVWVKEYIALNNSQIYNNSGDGMLLYRTKYFVINNSHIYNNSGNGVYFAGTENGDGIFNNVFSYNNRGRWIYSEWGNYYFYGTLTVFDNIGWNYYANPWSINAWWSTYSYLWRTAWTPDISQCMNCSRVTNMYNNNLIRLIDTTTYPKCNKRGQDLTRTGAENLSYKYGISLTWQKQPVYRDGTTLSNSPLTYNSSQYVAEINKLSPDYTNTTCTCVGHSYRWNNDTFLSWWFWNNNPNYCDIIAALYGTGNTWEDITAYTQNRSWRSNACNVENMNVVYTGNLNLTGLSANTIYVMTGNYSIWSGVINTNNCNTIISKNITGTTFYSTIQLSSQNGMFYTSYKQWNIFDNLSINGTGGGLVPNHTNNLVGIYLAHSANNTINNIQTYNNDAGIDISTSQYNMINNVKTYNNNLVGIYLDNTTNSTINNIQAYNNYYGIVLDSNAINNTINNTQIYNNNGWIAISTSGYNALNNIQVYNNNTGIILDNTINNTINNTQVYSNNVGIYLATNAINNKYYGTNIFFNNNAGDFSWTTTNFTTWGSFDYPGIFSNGTLITTGIMSRDYINNPINTLGNYLLAWTGIRTGMVGQQTTYTSKITDKYSYGSGILTQTQPVLYSGTTLTTWGLFDTTKFIWSDITKITGDLLGVPITTDDAWLTVTGISNSPLVTKYNIMWDTINNYSDININTSTDIYISNGIGNKNIITQIINPTSYFAMHFQKNTALTRNIDCKIWWDNNNFITETFWNGTVTDDNIICALYGTWNDDQTAYTENWSWYQDSCDVATMSVVYTGKLSLTTLSPNTIYVLTWPVSTWSSTINMSNCTTVISNQSTGTLLQSTIQLGNGLFYQTSAKQYVIFDNLSINWTWGWWVPAHTANYFAININQYGTTTNTTLHNITSYNGERGFFLYWNYIYGQDIIIYNNSADGIYLQGSHNILNNIDLYNNWWDGGIFVEEWCSYCSFNNIQTHNNLGGLTIYGMENCSFNNIQAYNNRYAGILIWWETNIFHNTLSYNNGTYWLYNASTDIKYYGTIQFYNNTQNIGAFGGMTTWYASQLPWFWRADGEIITTGTMSRDYVTNPINTLGNYFLSWSGTRTGMIGRQQATYNNTSTNKYSYGSGIFTQIQPVLYSGTTLKTGGMFNSTKYIWSDTTKITGDTTIIWTTIFWSSNNPAISLFSVFWDIETFKIWQAINTSTGVIFTTWIVTNKIITQLYSPTYFATHFQKETQPWLLSIYFTGTTPDTWATITGNNFAPQIEMINIENIDTFNYIFNDIIYPYYDSWLLFMMNFDKVSALSETDGLIKDFSQNAIHCTGYGNTLRTTSGRRNGSYIFNGVDSYLEAFNHYDFTLPITISMRVNFDDIHYRDALLLTDPDPSKYYGIYVYTINTGLISASLGNGVNAGPQGRRTRHANSNFTTWTWYYISVTRTNPTATPSIYIDGQEQTMISDGWTATSVVNSGTSKLWIGWWYMGTATTKNILSWSIDEIRIRNRVLSSGEILQMRRSNFQKYDIDKWRLTDDRQCMTNNTYTYTWYVKNTIGLSDTTGRTTIIDIQNTTPYAPRGHFLGSTGVSSQQITLSGQFTGYFKLEDWKGTTGWYTTIQLPLKLSGMNTNTNYIDRDQINFWATGINEIWWWIPTPQVYVTWWLATPQTFSGAIKYMIRDFVEWYSCPAGVYGNKPYISVDIPAYQNPDTYSGIITIDLNN